MAENTAILKFDLHKEQGQCKRLKAEAGLYKNMARTYWDRELQKDKNAYMNNTDHSKRELEPHPKLEFFQLSMKSIQADLKDPVVDGVPTEIDVGRGSFSATVLRNQSSRKIIPFSHYQRRCKE